MPLSVFGQTTCPREEAERKKRLALQHLYPTHQALNPPWLSKTLQLSPHCNTGSFTGPMYSVFDCDEGQMGITVQEQLWRGSVVPQAGCQQICAPHGNFTEPLMWKIWLQALIRARERFSVASHDIRSTCISKSFRFQVHKSRFSVLALTGNSHNSYFSMF